MKESITFQAKKHVRFIHDTPLKAEHKLTHMLTPPDHYNIFNFQFHRTNYSSNVLMNPPIKPAPLQSPHKISLLPLQGTRILGENRVMGARMRYLYHPLSMACTRDGRNAWVKRRDWHIRGKLKLSTTRILYMYIWISFHLKSRIAILKCEVVQRNLACA